LRLLDRAAKGEDIVIARAGKPVARLVTVAGKPRQLGWLKGKLEIPADFDAPLPDSMLAAFEGRDG
jgi:antitoxin (DNA-binding transcriptional repressor) of toxin-antitoxin stability system